jgi:hypothetical protein
MRSLQVLPILIATGLALSTTTESAAQQGFSQAAINSARARLAATAPGLVKIWVSCDGAVYEGAGVVFTAQGHILTAAHVGKACIGVPNEVWAGAVTSIYGVPNRTHRADIIERISDGVANPTQAQAGFTRKQDIALYRLRSGQAPIAPARISSDPPLAGDALHVVGFADLPFVGANDNRSAGPSIFRTTLVSVGTGQNDIPARLHYEGGAWKGMSGGPVYNGNNQLVGIHSARATLDVVDLVNEQCDPQQANCFGNALAFDLQDPAGAAKRQVINVDFNSVKSILENYGWATSVFSIPASWPKP